MAQVSQIFGLENGPGDIQLDDISEEESDDENRDDEIKKLLEEGLSNETFDCDSDTSYQNESKFSNHNNCSFVSNKEDGSGSINGGGGNGRESGASGGGGDYLLDEHEEGIFQTPKINGNANIGNTNGPVKFKRVDYSNMPNTINTTRRQYDDRPQEPFPVQNGAGRNGGGVDLMGFNGNGIHHLLNTNGNISMNKDPNGSFNVNLDAVGRFIPTTTPKPRHPEKNNNVTERNQKNCEVEEIEVASPTISLLHKDHCPKSGNEGFSDKLLLSAENNVEQLKAMCEFRERQVQRAESSVAALQKDKRALNHQIGLMKTEMVQMKSHYDEAEKFAQLKEEEVIYLKSKIQEAIEEYEKARRDEAAAQDHCGRLQLEIDKLCQEVKLLSSLGASTQQAEINDVVRQLREKHALDITSWRKAVADLEGQLNVYKRLRHRNEESHETTKESVHTQTEYLFEEEIERRERELAAQEFQEEFGGIGEAFLNELKNLHEPDIVKRVRQEWKTERDKLVTHFQAEIKIYQRKLATLPSELYQMWQQTQDELGLNKPPVIKPIFRTTSTMTEDKLTRPPISHKSTSLGSSMIEIPPDRIDASTFMDPNEFKEEAVQVNFAAVLASAEEIEKRSKGNGDQPSGSTLMEEKETSSVIVQTDETLETYKILAALIDNWSREATACKRRAEFAETKTNTAEEELKALNLKFRQLQKATHSCRKQWKKQEESLRSANTQMKEHYVEIMKKLEQQLAQVDQIDV